jgi:predicted RNase H-like HicB family nuclease
MKTVRVFIERGKDGFYSAYLPDVNSLPFGVIGVGDTVEATITDFKNVYEEMNEDAVASGETSAEAEFTFSYDVPSFLLYYADLISYKGLSKITGISPSQLSQYISGYRTPSPKTIAKIQAALNSFGEELSRLELVCHR